MGDYKAVGLLVGDYNVTGLFLADYKVAGLLLLGTFFNLLGVTD